MTTPSEGVKKQAPPNQCQAVVLAGPNVYHCTRHRGHHADLWHSFRIDDEGLARLAQARREAWEEAAQIFDKHAADHQAAYEHYRARSLGNEANRELENHNRFMGQFCRAQAAALRDRARAQ